MHSVYTFTIYLHTKFHMPSSNGSLVPAFKLKTKHRLQRADTLFYSLQITVTKVAHSSNIYYHKIFLVHMFNNTVTTSQKFA
jgi:hypothetical protein